MAIVCSGDEFVSYTTVVWFRNDLRLRDHEPLVEAIARGASVIPVYCFDRRQFGRSSFGFAKTGRFRGQFLLESVADLRRSLRAIGADLVIRVGAPEIEIPTIVRHVKASAVHYHEEVTAEELVVDRALEAALADDGIELAAFWGSTLYHPDDLPFAIAALPDLFTQFRKRVEQDAKIYPPHDAPHRLPPLPGDLDVGALPKLADLYDPDLWAELGGEDAIAADPRGVLTFTGGESAGWERLQDYFWRGDHLRRYKQTRNGMLGADYSSKFSPWLALGCLSPKSIHAEVQRYERDRVQNDSTYWLIFELLWRDYFRFVATRYGNALFKSAGLQGLDLPWQQPWPQFDQWRAGKTGFPLVDANMRELAATGFMSNRGRQNVASFLTKNLGIDWRMGAEWFESQLIDYDVCSNWGNWTYTAGVGNDARGFRFFNIFKQSKDYDPDGSYVKYWLPELGRVPIAKIHQPWQLTAEEQRRCGVQLGVDYPNPMVDLFQSAAANERLYNAAIAPSGPQSFRRSGQKPIKKSTQKPTKKSDRRDR